MKGKIAAFVFLSVFLCAFCGCREEPAAPKNVVVKAQVTYERKGEILNRYYDQPDKLRQLLMCLRLQELRGKPEVDPERIVGDKCKILLTYCDGSKTVILERANRYRSRNFEAWEEIEEEDTLYPLLLAIPGDVSETWAWINSGRRCPAEV